MDTDVPKGIRPRRAEAGGAPDMMAVVFGALSLWALWTTVGELKNSALARHSAGWAKVSGAILDARIAHVTRGFRHSWTCWYPVIRYAYTVAGHAYEGNRATFEDSCSDAFARDIVERYPAGRQVDVFYDPSAPTNAVLEPVTFKLHGVGSIIFGLLATALFASMAAEQGLAAVYIRRAERRAR